MISELTVADLIQRASRPVFGALDKSGIEAVEHLGAVLFCKLDAALDVLEDLECRVPFTLQSRKSITARAQRAFQTGVAVGQRCPDADFTPAPVRHLRSV